jgi:hypothetical protein
MMRGHLAGVRAAAFGAAVLTSLVFVGSALAVTIQSFNPTSGLPAKDNGEACPGNTIMIIGSGFVNDNPSVVVGSPQSTVTVTFGGVKSTYVVVGSNTNLYAVVPDGAKDGPIVVTTAVGSDSSAGKTITGAPGGNFYVNPCPQVSLKAATAGAVDTSTSSTPTIHKFKPLAGKVGTAVTISGTNLLRVSGVAFGGVKAKFTKDGPTQITATVPKGARTGKIVLSYSLTPATSQNPGGGIAPNNLVGNSAAPSAAQVSPRVFRVT